MAVDVKYRTASCCPVLQPLNCRCSHAELVQGVIRVFFSSLMGWSHLGAGPLE